MVCRLVEQKGLDLLLANRNFFLERDCRLVVLGAGEKRLEDELARSLAAQAPGKVCFSHRLNEKP